VDRFEYEISSPAEYSVGASYHRNNLTLSGNVSMIDYAKMKFGNYDSAPEKNADIIDLMRSVINLNAGFEYTLRNSRIALRGGFMMMPSPFKDDPSDFDKKFVTAGVGYNFSKSSSINFAYVYGWWQDVGDNYGSNISRTFQEVKFNNFVTSVKFNL
jgi:long-subunit fatty acid transport protein